MVAQQKFAIDVLQDSTGGRGRFFPSGVLVGQLLADSIYLKSIMIDVKKVAWHWPSARYESSCHQESFPTNVPDPTTVQKSDIFRHCVHTCTELPDPKRHFFQVENLWERSMTKRRRFKQAVSLADRLATFAKLMRERAELMAPGAERTATLAKANQADATADMDRWMRSPELKHPE